MRRAELRRQRQRFAKAGLGVPVLVREEMAIAVEEELLGEGLHR